MSTYSDQHAGQDPAEPSYAWALGSEPTTLYVQLPAVGGSAATAGDAMQQLFRQRGFQPVTGDDAADAAGVANGCALVREDEERALLVVSISDRIGATQIPVPHGDPAWSEQVFSEGRALVVLTAAAIGDGGVTVDGLRRDAEEGGLFAALVPAGQL